MTKPWHIIPKISKAINHDSTIVVVELLTNITGGVYDVEFIFENMQI
jgi:tRNA A58 N-methylase Trm61